MDFLLLLSAVQIITESFPISSSGHVAMLIDAISRSPVEQAALFAQIDSLQGLLHVPTLITLALVYFHDWFFLVRHMLRCCTRIIKIAFLSFISCAITALVYFVVKPQQMVGIPLLAGFIISAGALVSVCWAPKKNNAWNISSACVLGLVQACALVPGISRMALTYSAGVWLGISGRRALQISFLIQVPLIIGSFALAYCNGDLSADMGQLLNSQFCLSMLISTMLACVGLYFTVACATKYRMWYFSVYLLLACLVWMYLKLT